MTRKLRVIFLGTPAVAAAALRRIAASPLTSVVGVVTQPPRPAGRRRALHPSAVQKEAESLGLRVLTPSRIAGDETFLATLLEEELRPDLCVTMAFGQILPNAFLRVPTVGTINIHPSLLPDLRGAAPVQRALERGDESAGVSVLTTVRALDAGPILAQGRVDVGEGEQAPELLERLVNEGTSLLLDEVVPALLAAVSLVLLCYYPTLTTEYFTLILINNVVGRRRGCAGCARYAARRSARDARAYDCKG